MKRTKQINFQLQKNTSDLLQLHNTSLFSQKFNLASSIFSLPIPERKGKACIEESNSPDKSGKSHYKYNMI
jgi:hypothetical protein